MSSRNVEVVRRIFDHWTAGAAGWDIAAIAAPFDEGLLAPDSKFTPLPHVAGMGGETYVGLDGFREFVRSWTAEWTDWRIELEKAIDAGDGSVVAVVHQSAVGRRSGAPVSVRFWMHFKFSDGQVVDRTDYGDREALLEAAGLSGTDL